MGRGRPCSPSPRRPLPPEQGAGASPRDRGDYRGGPQAGPGPVAAVAAPGFPPLTRVAPGYQQH